MDKTGKAAESLEEILKRTGLPVKYYFYKGTQPEYIVYNEEAERDTAYADDEARENVIWWQVHVFTPKSGGFRKHKDRIRKLLRAAGYSIEDTVTLYEEETETMHVVISCSILEDDAYGGD